MALVVVEYKADNYKFFDTAARSASSLSRCFFAHESVFAPLPVQPGGSVLNSWANARSRARASSGVAMQRPSYDMPGGRVPQRERPSLILFIVDLDPIRSRIGHQGKITTAPRSEE